MMTHAPRNDLAAFAGLALAGIAAYAGYRAIDAERRIADPDAEPLIDHIARTAKADLTRLRDGLENCLNKASDRLQEFAEEVDAKAEGLKDRAAGTGTKDGFDAGSSTNEARYGAADENVPPHAPSV